LAKTKTFKTLRSFVAIILIVFILSVPESSGYVSWAWRVEHQLDRSEYPPGSQGEIDEWVVNTGPTVLHIYTTGITFDWDKESGKWWYAEVNVEVEPSERVHLAKIPFNIPAEVTPGKYQYILGLKHRHLGLREGWQDDGLQWDPSTYEILISEAEKRAEFNLEVVDVKQTPEKDEPIYIGDTGTITFTLKNTGGATAKQVRVALEDIRENVISIVESTPAKDLEPDSTGEWTIKARAEKAGNTTAKLRFYVSETKLDEIELPLVIHEPNLELISTTRTPEEGETIYPDDTLTATFTMKNKGPATVKELKLSVEPPSGLTLIESNPPINLEPGATGELFFKMRADNPGEYKVKIPLMKSGVPLPSYKLSATIKVSEKTGWTGLAVLGGIGVLIVVALALVVSRRRKKPTVTAPATAAAFCPKCGAPASPNDYCENCGARLR